MHRSIEAVVTRLPTLPERPVRQPQGRLARFESMDDAEFITWAYANVLEREPDRRGWERWIGDLSTGAINREDVLLIMLTSDEFAEGRELPGSEFVPTGHFYSAVPSDDDRRWAIEGERTNEPIVDVDLRTEAQLELIRSLAPLADDFPFAASAELARDQGHRYHHENSAFGIGDGALLYSLMRHLAPRRVIEVGCGYSSALMLDTADMHLDGATEFTFIEPFPDLLHSLIDDDDRERITIRPVAVQDVDLTVFDQLEAGDICFIDSTHVSKLGSDVNRLMFDVLPRLAPGVVIHIHDIDHGFGYPDQWISEGRAWNESYLVRAFLAFNDSFEIMAWNPYLHREHREFMDTQVPMAATERGNSLWLRRTA